MTAPSSVTFADLLRHHRTAAGLTQEELAARAHLSVDAVSTLERGARRRPRKDTVALLAEALALPDEEHAAFVAAARRASAATLTATPPAVATAGLDGHVPASAALEAALPHGVVTFLFTDIEGSTRLLQRLGGDRYASMLAELQALLRSIWAAHFGHELGTQDDHFFAVFAAADDALAAAAEAQQALAAQSWPDGTQVRLCMGLHSCNALLTAGRYVGLEVHRAGRIAAAGHGGQIVVSGALAEQVAKFDCAPPEGTSLRSLGKHRLQGLPHREQLYQLVVPGLPANYPPLRTLDAWQGLQADLTVVVCMSAVVLAVVGLALPLIVPSFPWAIGLGAAGLAVLVLVAAALAQPVRRALQTQWRDARKPVSAITSALLSLVVVVTALFVTKPPLILGLRHPGYDFSYTYHPPTQTGGAVVVGMWRDNLSLAPPTMRSPLGLPPEQYEGLWNACVVQLPDLTLGLNGWKADQCREVPTVANGEEDPVHFEWTIFHIDPRAVWSDGQPITADDFLFGFRLIADPTIGGLVPGTNLMTLSKLDTRTVRIDWSQPYGDYLTVLAHLTPLPLHVYATGTFAAVYDAATGAYNTSLAQQLASSDAFNTTIPVDNGPFTVQSFTPNGRAILVKNPRFFSNFFHHPAALDKVTILSRRQSSPDPPQAALIAMYRQGGLTLAEGLEPANLSQFGGIPKNEVVSSPFNNEALVGFNQRDVAPNARANGGVSIFDDITVRKAFVEAFDRCAAVRAVLGIGNCADPNFHTDELTAPPAPDYDPTFTLPAYNPTEAAALLDQAGYPVVDGIRRFKDGTTPMQLILATAFGGRPSYGIVQRMQQDYVRNLKIRVSIVTPSPPSKLFDSFDQGGIGATGVFDLWAIFTAASLDPVGQFVGFCCESADIPSAQNPLGGNYVGVVDPLVAARDQLGSQTLDADQRAAVYRDLQRHIAQQLYFEPLYIDADVMLAKPTLCNFKKWPAPGLNTWNMADWYVAPSCA